MKIEDYENLTDVELRQRAIECFEQVNSVDQLIGTIYLPKARFYLDEIERRKNDKITRRDFRMELAVIALIGLELITAFGLAWWGGRQQAKEVNAQLDALHSVQSILSNLQDSSKATAETLKQLKGVTDTMNDAVQKQVELYYDVQLNIVYDPASRRVGIINQGRSAVKVWDGEVGQVAAPLPQTPAIVAPNGGIVYALLNKIYDDAVKSVPKDSTLATPYLIYVENENHKRFTVHCTLTALWESDALMFRILTNSISPGWDIEKGPKKTP